MDLPQDKITLRGAMLARRAALSEAERRAASERLVETFRRERPIGKAAVVSGFWPIKDELDIRPLMIELVNEGRRLALPVVVGRGQRLLFRAWRPGDALEQGVFGTQQPAVTCEMLEPEALILPLLACDDEGWRLGYGGGFYDRTLAGLRKRQEVVAMGVGFDVQFVPEVPHGPEDQRIDWLLTEKRACAFV